MSERTYRVQRCTYQGGILNEAVPARVWDDILWYVAMGAMEGMDVARYHDRETGAFYRVERVGGA